MPTSDEVERLVREARDRLLEAMRLHEAEDHHGLPCAGERANALAYLCHCLGISRGGLARVGIYLMGYEEECRRQAGCGHHPYPGGN